MSLLKIWWIQRMVLAVHKELMVANYVPEEGPASQEVGSQINPFWSWQWLGGAMQVCHFDSLNMSSSSFICLDLILQRSLHLTSTVSGWEGGQTTWSAWDCLKFSPERPHPGKPFCLGTTRVVAHSPGKPGSRSPSWCPVYTPAPLWLPYKVKHNYGHQVSNMVPDFI